MIKTVLFITEQGSRIGKSGHSLTVYKDRERIFIYPLEQITQLVIMGRVEVTTAMLGLLMGTGIETVFMSRDGRFKGRLIGKQSRNIIIREKQFALRQNPEVVLEVSRQIILAKIKNTSHVLRRLHHSLWEEMRPRIRNALQSVGACQDVESLRGMGGSFAALYFRKFPLLLKQSFGFKKRQKHPPPDPLNILFSLGYTLLFNSIYALVEAAGMDPYAGFYHQTDYGHPALVSDLMEPFRVPVIDRLVVALVNNELITPESFIREKEKWQLTEEALKTYVTKYQQRPFQSFAIGERQSSVWKILQGMVWDFQKYLKGERKHFSPYLFR